MAISVQIAKIESPDLEFGGHGFFRSPRRGLQEAGPFDLRFGSAHRAEVRLAVIGPLEMINMTLAWLERCRNAIKPLAETSQDGDLIEFPGFEEIFRSKLTAESRMTIALPQAALDTAMGLKPYDAFSKLVDIYSSAILTAKREFQPDVVICAIPKAIEDRYRTVSRPYSSQEKRAAEMVRKRQASDQFELPLGWEEEESSEDLLTRDFRRALKAEAMRHDIPIQIVRTNLLVDSKSNEEPAIRAWNSCVGMYYKAGGIPWRIQTDGPETCFVGVTFHYLRTTHRSLVYSSLAQAFSSTGEGFALKGSTLEPDSGQRRAPHMTAAQAQELGRRVLSEYRQRNGIAPKRIVLHKSSRFSEEETLGFRDAFRDIPILRLIAIAPSSVRLVTHAAYPPQRGTLLTLEGARSFLFTSGYIEELATYPGPHVPAPVEIIVQEAHSPSEMREACGEILALGRLNWNTSDLRSSQPVTLGFARRVGGVMAEYGLSCSNEPNPSYRYYM
jgi:hypothetical protein